MNNFKDSVDVEFAYKIRRALNESADRLPEPTLNRLAQARKAALARKKTTPSAVLAFKGVLAGSSGFNFNGPDSWMGKFGLALPLLVLVFGLVGIYEYEQQAQINDLADIDVAVLADELPPDAYVDSGFTAYLKRVEE
jgi:hypothetical protein